MSKRKLSFKEREELQPTKNKSEKEKSKERLSAVVLTKDAREEKKQSVLDGKDSSRNAAPTLATDWSVIPTVDWDATSLPAFERNFLTCTKNNTNASSGSDTNPDSSLRLEHSVEISIICGPNQQNIATSTYSLSALPFFATFADERIPSPLRQYLALASQSSNNESSDGKEQKKKEKEFRRPTAVQSQAWALALSGENFVATAQTGSGKTLSYLIPAAGHMALSKQKPSPSIPSGANTGPRVLILLPTRELVLQVMRMAAPLRKHFGLEMRMGVESSFEYSRSLYGGTENAEKQAADLKSVSMDMLVATPARLLHMVRLGAFSLHSVTMLILDEADKLLNVSLLEQVTKISSLVRPDRQTILVSATFSDLSVQRCSAWIPQGRDFYFIKIGSLQTVNTLETKGLSEISSNIKQRVDLCAEHKKRKKLIKYLEALRDKESKQSIKSAVLIFLNTIQKVFDIYHFLEKENFRVAYIHGSQTQEQRTTALNAFRSGKKQILVASDLLSRGLDIKNIKIVINYDFPASLQDYIHRIGRTGRQETIGESFSFITKSQSRLIPSIVELLQEHSQPVNHVLLAYSIEYQKKKLAGENEMDTENGGGIEMEVETKPESSEGAKMKERNHTGSNNFKKHGSPTQNRISLNVSSNSTNANQNNANNADANPRPKKKHKNFNANS